MFSKKPLWLTQMVHPKRAIEHVDRLVSGVKVVN